MLNQTHCVKSLLGLLTTTNCPEACNVALELYITIMVTCGGTSTLQLQGKTSNQTSRLPEILKNKNNLLQSCFAINSA